MNHKENELVLPGEILCTYEEYIPSDWTYVEDGHVKASIYGRVKRDDINKTISIDSQDAPEHIKVEDIVIGHITDVKAHKALVTIKKVLNSKRELVAGYKGYVHISKATDGYVSSMHDLFKIGDIVEAKVITILGHEYIELTTAEDELGIIKAMCVNCRKFMRLSANHKLLCECGMIDSRKLSSKYGAY
ncbi:exosome complex RNA-binding protein Csl4 [Methanosphaera sp. WGK6]|uniref:exosome complex RNA-binding protein Csl4 n=1 Tax=Methanosphaera sp. WGK6 TaxID=1561964 RepID=UPI00084C5FB5|nr:exosome complex RNA-binding protein Csl4 [Methanosphaera sp. WGK6]OED30762.1 hypothetical protein NL43_00085 [Methanosphaera sp. WGK6]